MITDSTLPAILGGEPIRPQGPPDWPLADDAILEALREAYRDGSWGRYHGGHVEKLEQRLAEMHRVEHVLTCGSGTFAVELALRALKVGRGDEVVMAAYDYGGNFLGIHAVGAHPVLVEVDGDNWNLAPEGLAAAFGPTTRAVIVSHLHGGLVPMREVVAIAGRQGVPVVEDAAQAPGARVQGREAGTWGDVGILSFGGSKLLTAGRGGALLTRHADVAQRARLWLQRGNHVCPLSELQAAVLGPQLDRLMERNARRLRAVRLLEEQLRPVPGLRPFRNRTLEDSEPGYYKLGFQLDAARFGLDRERFVAAMRAEGIAVDAGFRALHVGRSPRRWRSVGPLPQAERAHHGTVVLHHPILLGEGSDLEQVARAAAKIHGHAERLR
ncbi:MAG TPA: aminotransferase class I/II-fold pyridoxal phosphate-dependent enzyme [Gemmataceae bacterium]|nr:aminotransferase class I/II-fold pyridoxal phosphate-dependent enzyme [Gemmataceae bacterium]